MEKEEKTVIDYSVGFKYCTEPDPLTRLFNATILFTTQNQTSNHA